MPMMKVYGVDRTICALGSVIAFVADMPTYVSPMLQPFVAAQGGVEVDGADAVTTSAPTLSEVVIPADAARAAEIKAAVRALMVSANPTDFTAGGAPKVASVTAITGFAVQSGEIAPIYHVVRAEMAEEQAAESAAAAAAAAAG